MHAPLFKSLFLATLGSLAFLPLASAITIRDDQADSSYLSLGADPLYQAAGEFAGGFGGTLIADPSGSDQYVVTATHLIYNNNVGIGSAFTIGGNTYTVASYVSAPGYDPLTQMNDLTIIRLSSSVTGVTPIPFYTGSAEQGQTFTMIGYGLTGTGATGATTSDGLRRGANNVIDAANASQVSSGLPSTSYLFDFDQPPFTPNTSFNLGSNVPLTLEGMIALGDSGGGDFAMIDGTLYLVGVHSYVAAPSGAVPNSGYGYLGGSTRVSLFSDFIEQNIPEPGSVALLVGGVGVVAGRRRRKG